MGPQIPAGKRESGGGPEDILLHLRAAQLHDLEDPDAAGPAVETGAQVAERLPTGSPHQEVD